MPTESLSGPLYTSWMTGRCSIVENLWGDQSRNRLVKKRLWIANLQGWLGPIFAHSMNQNFTMAYLSVTKSWLACRSPLRHWYVSFEEQIFQKVCHLNGEVFYRWRMAGTNSKVEIQGEAYEDRNKRLKRPISPHLTIHKFHNNMAQSIMHRFTGAALNGLLYSLAIGYCLFFFSKLTSSCDPDFLWHRGRDPAGIHSALLGDAGRTWAGYLWTQRDRRLPVLLPLFQRDSSPVLGRGILLDSDPSGQVGE